MSAPGRATAPVPPLPTLRDAVDHPLETLAALPRRGNAARIQAEIAASLLAAAADASPAEEPADAPPTFPAWHRCTPEQQGQLRRHKRSQSRLYHRSKPLRGLKAEDRVHEARTARAIGLSDDVRRARGRADWWLAFEESRYAADLDTTQRHALTGDRPPVGGQAGPAWGGGGGGGGGAAGS